MTIHLLSYTHSGSSLIDKITPCFSPLKIYVPWGGAIPEYADDSDLIVSYPPEELKPDADFNSLLNECFSWAYEQEEKSRKEIIKTGQTSPTSNESLRHIKTILSKKISDTSEKDMVLRWHMLLHLANRLEESRNDANRMLESLKKKPSPLMNNADLTENTQYPLESLRTINPDFFINDTNLRLLLRAWHGLFNSLIDRNDMLLCLDRRIFDHLSDEWDIVSNNSNKKNPGTIFFKSPLFNDKEKSVHNITISDDIEKIVKSNVKQEDKIKALKKLTSDFEARFREDISEKQILFSILFFQPPETPELIEKEPFLEFLSGRVLIFPEIHG